MVASSTSLKNLKHLKRTTLLTSTLFGGQPTDPPTVSQGSIFQYKDSECSWSQRLTQNAAALLLPDDCKPFPGSDILSVSINSLPECPQYGQPLLVLYDGPDCRSVHADAAQVGVVDACQTLENKRGNSNSTSSTSSTSSSFSTAVNIRSAKWICTGRGVPGTGTETMTYTAQPTVTDVVTATVSSDSGGSSCCSCCCNGCCKCGCVVM